MMVSHACASTPAKPKHYTSAQFVRFSPLTSCGSPPPRALSVNGLYFKTVSSATRGHTVAKSAHFGALAAFIGRECDFPPRVVSCEV
jgi:hypothetical protein